MATDLRAKKSGIGADIERKLEARYDQEEAAGTMGAIMVWVNAILKDEEYQEPQIKDESHKELHHSFRTGVKLCKLINVLLASDGKPPVPIRPKAEKMFIAYTNIDNYNKGCTQYGLAEEFLVQSADVWEGSKARFLNVINNLHSLGFLANKKGFGQTYLGEIEKKSDN